MESSFISSLYIVIKCGGLKATSALTFLALPSTPYYSEEDSEEDSLSRNAKRLLPSSSLSEL
jgi:hypothetical protein